MKNSNLATHRYLTVFRVGYIAALTAIAVLCGYFSVVQREQNTLVAEIGIFSRQLATLDAAMRAQALQASKFTEQYKAFGQMPDLDTVGMTLMEKREYRENRKIDPDIISVRNAFDYRTAKGRENLASVEKIWPILPEALRTQILRNARLLDPADPFADGSPKPVLDLMLPRSTVNQAILKTNDYVVVDPSWKSRNATNRFHCSSYGAALRIHRFTNSPFDNGFGFRVSGRKKCRHPTFAQKKCRKRNADNARPFASMNPIESAIRSE